ncbi:MAG: phosphoglucosamine mutase [Planctomycetes bacterium]|nr:phosphoglucosamine mutase [Planctomycetota bacterium]
MAIFGTDGIRGLANKDLLTPMNMVLIGEALGYLLRLDHGIEGGSGRNGNDKPRVLIGRDSRFSGWMLEAALTAGLMGEGVDVTHLALCTTPALSYAVMTNPFDAAVMVSASHNPFEDNGVKIFGHDGRKISDAREREIEKLIRKKEFNSDRLTHDRLGRTLESWDSLKEYIRILSSRARKALKKRPLKIVVDAANGGGAELSRKILGAANLAMIHGSPDGRNINDHCGATDTASLIRAVKKEKADLGVALDGDGDRCIFVDEKGKERSGDYFLAIAGLHLKSKGRLKDDTIVATILSNMGLEMLLAKNGIKLVRTSVGDRYVSREMEKSGFTLGGEQSGHIIIHDGFQLTGDGLNAAVNLIEIMAETGMSLSGLCKGMKVLPQYAENVKVAEKPPFEENAKIWSSYLDTQKALDGIGRVLLRYSGTESKARIMIEAKDEKLARAHIDRLRAVVASEIGV